MIINHKDIKLEVLSIETVASNVNEGRKNLAKHMEDNNIIASLYVTRPRGKKTGFFYVLNNGRMTNISWFKFSSKN